jgi:hypothetical protein
MHGQMTGSVATQFQARPGGTLMNFTRVGLATVKPWTIVRSWSDRHARPPSALPPAPDRAAIDEQIAIAGWPSQPMRAADA